MASKSKLESVSYRNKLISIGTSYFNEILRPSLTKEKVLETSLVSFGGSVAYGYCDKLSDIEIEISFKDKLKESSAKRIRATIADHPKFKGVKMGAGINYGWKLHLILHNKMKEFWKDLDPFSLFEETHVLPIWDPMKASETIKEKVSFYPHYIFSRVLRGQWIVANDNGSYNSIITSRRGNDTSANIFLFRGTEALLRIVFLVNRKYYPPTKWIPQELSKLEHQFHSLSHLEGINYGKSVRQRQDAFDFFIAEVRRYLRKKNLMSHEEIDDPWTIIKKPYFIYCTFS